jgi:hypothetical protein
MITLYTFGPAFGLPDPSPFVTKAEVLLKMAGLLYRTDTKGLSKAPKGKLPYIRDGEDIVADSTFIRLHLEKRYSIDFDTKVSRSTRSPDVFQALSIVKYLGSCHALSRWIEPR